MQGYQTLSDEILKLDKGRAIAITLVLAADKAAKELVSHVKAKKTDSERAAKKSTADAQKAELDKIRAAAKAAAEQIRS